MASIDTRHVQGRRAVSLATLDDFAAEVERVVAGTDAGRVRSIANWTPAQILQHIGRMVEFSLDGFPFRYPWPIRFVARLARLVSWRWLVAIAFRPGFRNPPAAAALEPDPTVALDEAASYLQRQLTRLRRGERMTYPSPAEGPITHEQWVYAHLRHAELHFSFVIVDGGALS